MNDEAKDLGHRRMPTGLLADIKQAAEKRQKAGVFGTADATKAELDRLGGELARRTGCILLTAPIKGEDRAIYKVENEYEGHWLDLKDVARITLAAPETASMGDAIHVIRSLFVPRNGYSLVKDVATLATVDDCGYSGHNFVLRFGMRPPVAGAGRPQATGEGVSRSTSPPGLRPIALSDAQIMAALNKPLHVPAYVGRMGEIQVNSVPMMFGKMSVKSFLKNFGPTVYLQCQSRYGVEGGAGHALYEVFREAQQSPEGQYAAALSKRYYRRLRAEDPKPSSGPDELREEVAAFLKSRPGH